MDRLRVLFLGDIVGKPGRQAVAQCLPALTQRYHTDVIIANAENASGGLGIAPETACELLDSGIDVLTLGNHVWKDRRIYDLLNANPRVLRPANYPAGCPGAGWGLFEKNGVLYGVANLSGRVFMDALDDPFPAADTLLERLRERTLVVMIDMHAEATSEKRALAIAVDGRCSAVLGTHTHVQTADARISAAGTAFVSDVGMCGPVESVLGMKPEAILHRFRTAMPARFELADGPAFVSGAALEIDTETGRCQTMESFQACPQDGAVTLRAVIQAYTAA